MNTSTTTPPPPTAAALIPNLPLVLVRSNAAKNCRAACDFLGMPEKNQIGLSLLAESIRLQLGLPKESIHNAFELTEGFVWVECGPILPTLVIQEILELLKRLNLELLFDILLADLREKFFRPYHQGGLSGVSGIISMEQLQQEAAAWLKLQNERMAAFQKSQRPGQ
jgi:hypothetical protein